MYRLGVEKNFGFAVQARYNRGFVRGQSVPAAPSAWVINGHLGSRLHAAPSAACSWRSPIIRVPACEERFAGPRRVATASVHTTGVLVSVGDEWKSVWRLLERDEVRFNHGPSSKADIF